MIRYGLLICLLGVGLLACKKNKPAIAKPAPPTGEACPDVDAKSARLRCQNNNLEFCSVHSNHKWAEAQKCPVEQECFIVPDGKGGGCR